MKAVILAAGEGARMGPFTASVPKVMIPVGNRPLLESAIQALVGSGGKPAVLITQSERPRSYGVATVEGDRLVAITEKPVEMISNLINTGAYALDERIFEEIDRLAKDGKHDLPSAVSALAERTPVLAIRTEGTWVDALYPWDLLRLNATALKGTHEVRSATIEPAVTIA